MSSCLRRLKTIVGGSLLVSNQKSLQLLAISGDGDRTNV